MLLLLLLLSMLAMRCTHRSVNNLTRGRENEINQMQDMLKRPVHSPNAESGMHAVLSNVLHLILTVLRFFSSLVIVSLSFFPMQYGHNFQLYSFSIRSIFNFYC